LATTPSTVVRLVLGAAALHRLSRRQLLKRAVLLQLLGERARSDRRLGRLWLLTFPRWGIIFQIDWPLFAIGHAVLLTASRARLGGFADDRRRARRSARSRRFAINTWAGTTVS
jgi:hypothetical protein